MLQYISHTESHDSHTELHYVSHAESYDSRATLHYISYAESYYSKRAEFYSDGCAEHRFDKDAEPNYTLIVVQSFSSVKPCRTFFLLSRAEL